MLCRCRCAGRPAARSSPAATSSAPAAQTNQSAGQPVARPAKSAIAKVLKQAGYATGMCGKWRQMGATPGDWGFDEYITDPTAGGWYWKTSYTKNGKLVETKQDVYCPDVCLEFAVDFFRRHRDQPFYFYFPTHLVHGPILRTPDSKGDGKADYYEDNVAYLDKQVGAARRRARQARPAREDAHRLHRRQRHRAFRRRPVAPSTAARSTA